jgi:hypothetical protein
MVKYQGLSLRLLPLNKKRPFLYIFLLNHENVFLFILLLLLFKPNPPSLDVLFSYHHTWSHQPVHLAVVAVAAAAVAGS